jgi:hypothetical protein
MIGRNEYVHALESAADEFYNLYIMEKFAGGRRRYRDSTGEREVRYVVRTWDSEIIDTLVSRWVVINKEYRLRLETYAGQPWHVTEVVRTSDPKRIRYHANPGVDALVTVHACVTELAMRGYGPADAAADVLQHDHFFNDFGHRWGELVWEMVRSALVAHSLMVAI